MTLEKHLGENEQPAAGGDVHIRVKRADEEEFREVAAAGEVPKAFEEAGRYAHTDYQKEAATGFHIHWRISSGAHGPGPDGNIALGMVHDIIASNVEEAILMAKEAAPDHQEFIVNAQFHHHRHPDGAN